MTKVGEVEKDKLEHRRKGGKKETEEDEEDDNGDNYEICNDDYD